VLVHPPKTKLVHLQCYRNPYGFARRWLGDFSNTKSAGASSDDNVQQRVGSAAGTWTEAEITSSKTILNIITMVSGIGTA
jgi:hypothetical protein